jgi:hypothetical protein
MAAVRLRSGSDTPDGAIATAEFGETNGVSIGLSAFIRVQLRFQLLSSFCRAANTTVILNAIACLGSRRPFPIDANHCKPV